MAMVAADPPFVLDLTIYASNGRHIVKPYNLAGATYTDASANTAAILAAFADVSAGVVSAYSLKAKFENDAFALPSSNDAEWGEEAIVTGKVLDKPLKPVAVRIPFPKITLFQGTSGKSRDKIDTNFSNETTTHLNAYLDLFRTGGEATVSDGELLETDGTALEGKRL